MHNPTLIFHHPFMFVQFNLDALYDWFEIASLFFDGTNLIGFCLISATSNSILDRAIDSEDALHKDFLRLVREFTWSSTHIKE